MIQRFIQDPITLTLVPADEYRPPVENRSPLVMPDIQPYRSTIDGSIIGSRSKHRAHLRDHGCIEVGNEKQVRNTPVMDSPKEDLIRAARQHGLIPS